MRRRWHRCRILTSEPRLKAGIWVRAALRQAQVRGSFGAVVAHGDDDAGGVLVLLRDRAGGITILDQTRRADGEPAWLAVRRGVDAMEADEWVTRARGRDPDLWVVEFDAEGGIPPFDAVLVA